MLVRAGAYWTQVPRPEGVLVDVMPTALFVRHQALPGKRDDVRRIWEKYVQPRAAVNPGHLAYYFCYDIGDPDVICVFQLYLDETAVTEFLGGEWYPEYLAEVGTAVAAPPQLTRASLVWAKPVAEPGE
ncbi:MAG: putative quinol monooxygenase [Planctomycetia bacterium]